MAFSKTVCTCFNVCLTWLSVCLLNKNSIHSFCAMFIKWIQEMALAFLQCSAFWLLLFFVRAGYFFFHLNRISFIKLNVHEWKMMLRILLSCLTPPTSCTRNAHNVHERFSVFKCTNPWKMRETSVYSFPYSWILLVQAKSNQTQVNVSSSFFFCYTTFCSTCFSLCVCVYVPDWNVVIVIVVESLFKKEKEKWTETFGFLYSSLFVSLLLNSHLFIIFSFLFCSIFYKYVMHISGKVDGICEVSVFVWEISHNKRKDNLKTAKKSYCFIFHKTDIESREVEFTVFVLIA